MAAARLQEHYLCINSSSSSSPDGWTCRAVHKLTEQSSVVVMEVTNRAWLNPYRSTEPSRYVSQIPMLKEPPAVSHDGGGNADSPHLSCGILTVEL